MLPTTQHKKHISKLSYCFQYFLYQISLPVAVFKYVFHRCAFAQQIRLNLNETTQSSDSNVKKEQELPTQRARNEINCYFLVTNISFTQCHNFAKFSATFCVFLITVSNWHYIHFLTHTTHIFVTATFSFQKIILYLKCLHWDYFLHVHCETDFVLTLPKTSQ